MPRFKILVESDRFAISKRANYHAQYCAWIGRSGLLVRAVSGRPPQCIEIAPAAKPKSIAAVKIKHRIRNFLVATQHPPD